MNPRILTEIILFLYEGIVHAQVHGTVSDRSTKEKLVGASIIIKGKNLGTISDTEGRFEVLAVSGDLLELSYIGYKNKTIAISPEGSELQVYLESDPQQLEEVIITGVFDPRKRIESSVAITTITTKQLQYIVPNSSSELLRMVPGVFVQSARGELRNQIYSRGMVFDGSVYYISMQEDGLPMVSGQSGNPGGYLRSDIGLQKIEAVRGGSASILGVNAPGGIFNYISKTGGDQFEGMISSRVGLEGNGRNPYLRMEGSMGGPLSNDKSWTYHIGGHYRRADGAKYPGYPLSHGGQIKWNIVKTYSSGSLKFYAKWLDDHTKDFEFTPTRDFDKPRPAGQFKNYSSVLIDAVQLTIPSSGDGVRTIDYDSRDLNHLKDNSLSLHWEQRLGSSWKTSHALKYAQKRSTDVGTFIVYPSDVSSFLFNIVFDIFGNQGKYKFSNAATKQVYGTLTHDFTSSAAFTFDGNLPGADIISNGVFFTPLYYVDSKLNDFFYQGTVSKTWNTMKVTGGLYSNKSRTRYYNASASSGTGLSTIEDKPQLIAIEYAPADGGPVQHYTDPLGVSGYNYGPIYAQYNDVKTWDNALFIGHQWDINSRLNLDWGARYEWFRFSNSYRVPTANQKSTSGGFDKNPLTIYDNYSGALTAPVFYKKRSDAYSHSGGLNYKHNKNLAFYVRYSNGSKVADISTYTASQDAGSSANVLPQETIQLEGGVKYQSKTIGITVTPFLSILADVPYATFASNSVGSNATFYNLPVLYNKAHATGIELEASIQINPQWNIRSNAVIQQFYTDKYQTWNTNDLGPQDDIIIDQSGKKISYYAAPYIINITPSYQHKKIYAGLNWYSLARRTANINEAFYLPAFSQFDLNLSYALNKRINLKCSINNLFDHFGVMDWTAPILNGVFFGTFDTGSVTKETIKQNPNANYYTMAIQPRAFFLDCTIKL